MASATERNHNMSPTFTLSSPAPASHANPIHIRYTTEPHMYRKALGEVGGGGAGSEKVHVSRIILLSQ